MRNYLPLERDWNQITQGCLCQVWLKLAQWFWRSRFFIFVNVFFYFVINSPWKRVWPFIWTNLNLFNPRMLCAKFVWNWPSNSAEEDFKISLMYFCYFVIISISKRTEPFIWRNFNLIHPRMICTKFSWNLLSGSGEEEENVQSLRQWRRRRLNNDADDGQRTNCDQKSLLEPSAQVSWKKTHGIGFRII